MENTVIDNILRGLLLFLLTFTFWLTPLEAQADTPNCVTLAEFNEVMVGQRMSWVHAIWDDKGVNVLDPGKYQYRVYNSCNNDYRVEAGYHKSDSGIWLMISKDRIPV